MPETVLYLSAVMAQTQNNHNSAEHTATDAASVRTRNWKLLAQFNLYRILIAGSFLGLSLVPGSFPPFGQTAPGWFALAALLYAVISIGAIFTLRLRTPDFESQATVLAFVDISLITILMGASGGVGSGLGLFMLVAVAECSVLLSRRMTIFYASLGAVAALIEHSWGLLVGSGVTLDTISKGYPQVGLLGIGLFITGTLGNTLANRLRSTTALAEKRGVDLANLHSVNELIIERMQSGVVVCDQAGHVRQMNLAAQTFLNIDSLTPDQPLAEVSAELDDQLREWSEKPVQRTMRILRTAAGFALLPRFINLGDKKNRQGTLIFLEDTEALKQQAQQLKMAALARLTASIAHEIRNPLSAMTNAGQLLKESTEGDEETQRLLKIIENHGKRMNVIVENITQLARRDRTEPVRLNLPDWVREFVTQYTQGAEIPPEAIIVSSDDPALETCVDPDQLYQVVTNLCQNALRHSPPFESKPLIQIQTYTNDKGRPVLEVVDWGPGVPPDIVDSIFDPFFTTTPQGTGLGLYICRELCEGNGGRLDHIAGGSGATFRATLARGEECFAAGTK
jgi:two-component system sensor histidine kinase PilS (NtrC family)